MGEKIPHEHTFQVILRKCHPLPLGRKTVFFFLQLGRDLACNWHPRHTQANTRVAIQTVRGGVIKQNVRGRGFVPSAVRGAESGGARASRNSPRTSPLSPIKPALDSVRVRQHGRSSLPSLKPRVSSLFPSMKKKKTARKWRKSLTADVSVYFRCPLAISANF